MYTIVAIIALQLIGKSQSTSNKTFKIHMRELTAKTCGTNLTLRWRRLCYDSDYAITSARYFHSLINDFDNLFNEPPESPYVRVLNYECCEVGCSDNWIFFWYCKKPANYENPIEPGFSLFQCYDSQRNCYARGSQCHEYYGSKNTTLSGLSCQYWNSQTPNKHNWGPYTQETDNNYCRRFNSTSPWCYATTGNKRWEFCFTECECYDSESDCYTQHENCEGYFGNKSTTIDGLTCQKWSSQSPHTHDFGPFDDHNYCRSLSSSYSKMPSCLTTSPDKAIGTCIKPCETGCYNPITNCYRDVPSCYDYAGRKSVTVSGKTCQAWKDQTPHTHETHPDEEKNLNYCRRYSMKVPWCYTTDPIIRHEPCFFHCDQLKEVASAARDYKECFQAGQFFYSTWRNSTYGLLAVTQVNTSRRCYQACRANSGCNYWSYLSKDYLNVAKGCYLRVYRGGSMRFILAVSGPRDCDNITDPYREPDHNCIPFGNNNDGFVTIYARRLHVPTANSRDYTMENIQKFIPYKPFEENDAKQLKMLQLKVAIDGTLRLYFFPNVALNAAVVELLRDLNVEDAFKNAILVDIDFASDPKTIKMNVMSNSVWSSSPKTFTSWQYGEFDEGVIDEILIQFKENKILIYVHALGDTLGLSYHVKSELTNPSWIQQLSNIWFWSASPAGTTIYDLNQCTDGITVDFNFPLKYKLPVLPNFTLGSPPLKINYVTLYGFMTFTTVGQFDIFFQSNKWGNPNTVLELRVQYGWGKLVFYRNARINGNTSHDELSLIGHPNEEMSFSSYRGLQSFARFDFMFLEEKVNIAFMGKIICSFKYRGGFDAKHIIAIFVDVWSLRTLPKSDPMSIMRDNYFNLMGIDLQNAEYDDKLTKIQLSTPLPEGVIKYLNYTPVTTTPAPEPEQQKIFIGNHDAAVCFEKGQFYYNWWEEDQSEALRQVGALDYFKCFRACRDSRTCQFWSFVNQANQGVGRGCYFRTSIGGTMRLVHSISGPKDCRNPGCPFGWTQNGNACYFLLPGKYSSQSTAVAACRTQNHDANLPVFRDRAEWSDFDAAFLRFNLAASRQQLWLAGDDKVFEGKFFFQQSIEKKCEINFLNFGPGQPDGFRHENCLIRLAQSNEYSDTPCDTGVATSSGNPGAVCQIRGISFCDKQDYKQAPPIKSCQVLFNNNGGFNYLRYVSRAKYVYGQLSSWSYKDVPKLIPFKPQLTDENQLNLLQINVDVGDSMTFLFMEDASINNQTVELVKQGKFEEAFKNFIRLDFNFQFEHSSDRSMVLSVASDGTQTAIKNISRWRTNNIFTKWEIDVILVRFMADKIKFYVHGDQSYYKGLELWKRHNFMLEIFEVDKPSWFDKMENIWHIGSSDSLTINLFHCTSGVQVEQDQSRAFTYDFGNNFHAVRSGVPPLEANYVALYGYPSGAPDGNFQIHFLPSNNPDQNTVFTFSIRFWDDDAHVVRNAKFNGDWGEDETDMVKDIQEFPFLSRSWGNQNLTRMDFMFKETEINVAVNGFLFCTFAYRNGLNRQTIKSLKIERGPKDSDDTSTDGPVGYELFGIDVKYVEYNEPEGAIRRINPDDR